ncbi:hypothetical protein K227x_39870 [Rubripirellula lacrimiformis]|uniref:Uncharacterized protein n=1 Tax=Rubripirellula lacrimiformis TaxID=1930273 RepID=A0A517NEM8_9BACT|nr:hypothetical protein [Rubripirellula lacrimiformis]QDT05586.1 hypothetical protein K227x_39870 [Rubripirellula lacrimiformis]
MSLEPLANRIVEICRSGDTTPVLVTPKYLSFRPAFYQQFVAVLAQRSGRTVRIDWLRTETGIMAMISDTMAMQDAKRITRMLRKRCSADHSIELTSSIGRPRSATASSLDGRQRNTANRDDALVIGLCHVGQPLPEWVTPIPLGERPLVAA